MAGFVFESIMICRGLTLGGEGIGIRGISSLLSAGEPHLIFFARTRGAVPVEGVSFREVVTSLDGELDWQEEFNASIRAQDGRAVQLFASWSPEIGLTRGEYSVMLELESGEQVTSTFEVG
jgi:hypothetical protein